jgi:nuclear transport factor 2 (NTF2) superfamily protein
MPSFALASPTKETPDEHPASPVLPFTPETAAEKVRLAENGWNSRDPEKVALAYTVDSCVHPDLVTGLGRQRLDTA